MLFSAGSLSTYHVSCFCSQSGSIASYEPVFLVQPARTVQNTAKEIKIQQVSIKRLHILLHTGAKLVRRGDKKETEV